MNPYQWTVICDVCGGEGAATTNTMLAQWKNTKWGPSIVSHSNPMVCQSVLRAKRIELDNLLKKAQVVNS